MFVTLWIQLLLLSPFFSKTYIRTYILDISRQLIKTHLLREILCLYQQGSATTYTASIFVRDLLYASCENDKQDTAVSSFATSGALTSILLGNHVKGQKYYSLIILTLKTFERQHWGCGEQHVFRCDFYLRGKENVSKGRFEISRLKTDKIN
jgi:hypothetical protein